MRAGPTLCRERHAGEGTARVRRLLMGEPMKTSSMRWWIFVALLAGVGCATPIPVVRLSLDNPGGIWVAGRETAVNDVAGVRVAAAFERGTEGVITFRVEVQNDSEQAVEVSPSQIWFTRCRGPVGLVCDSPVYVRDPERALASIDRDAAVARADAINSEGLTSGLLLLSAVADVASLAAGDHSARSSSADTLALAHAEKANHELLASSIESTRQMWADVALRRTTVTPGHGAGGLVFMPADTEATFVRLTVAIGDRRFESVWEQRVLGGWMPPAQRHEAAVARIAPPLRRHD